jgi:hypothetical protein
MGSWAVMRAHVGPRSVALFAVVLMSVGACSSDQAVAPSTTTEPVDTTPALATESTSTLAGTPVVGSQVGTTGSVPFGGAPVLTRSYLSWDLYDWQQPLGLRSVFFYADGTGIELAGDIAGERPPTAVRFMVDSDMLRDVLEIGERARTSSRSGGIVPLPDGSRIQGGGRTVFVSQQADDRSVRTVDQLGMVPSAGDAERAALDELSSAIDRLVDGRTGEQPVVFDKWAVLSVDLPAVRHDAVGDTWLGQNLDQVEFTELDDGAECVVLAAAEFPPDFFGATSTRAVLNERTIIVRPLLPHETTCQDVEDWHGLIAR